jgi:hypothetical protein
MCTQSASSATGYLTKTVVLDEAACLAKKGIVVV